MAYLGKNRGPYSTDYNVFRHRNTNVTTTLHCREHDRIIKNLNNSYDYQVGYVPPGFEHRPDLISNVFYGTPDKWWLLMQVNNIADPFEGFNVNDRIFIPKP